MVQKQLSYNQMGGKWTLLLPHVIPTVHLKCTLDFSQKLKNYIVSTKTQVNIFANFSQEKNLLDKIWNTHIPFLKID